MNNVFHTLTAPKNLTTFGWLIPASIRTSSPTAQRPLSSFPPPDFLFVLLFLLQGKLLIFKTIFDTFLIKRISYAINFFRQRS